MSTPTPGMTALLAKVDDGYVVVCHAVPTRILRIVRRENSDWQSFRLEQLVEHSGFGGQSPRGEWKTLSMHNSLIPGGALKDAFAALAKAQADLVNKLRQRMAARAQMARNG